MATAQQHYDQLLASIYVWMAGGVEAALAAGTQDVAPLVPGTGLAIDLGAGFGMHAIPLARGGYDVLALDTSRELLDVLRANAEGLRIRTLEADLLDFRRHAPAPAALIVCMGDTLTHLASFGDVQRLLREVHRVLAPGGRFVIAIRDYTNELRGDARFIPVRADERTVFSCFLEYEGDHVRVYDVIHSRAELGWDMRVSSYK